MRLLGLPKDLWTLLLSRLDAQDLELLSYTCPSVKRIVSSSEYVKSTSLVLHYGAKLSNFVKKFEGFESFSLVLLPNQNGRHPLYPAPLLQICGSRLTSLFIRASNAKTIFFGTKPAPHGSSVIISEAFPLLKTLSICGWFGSDDTWLQSAFFQLPKSLTFLSVQEADYFLRYTFPNITHLVNLEHLHLESCTRFEGAEGFDSRNFPFLTSLSLPNFQHDLLIDESKTTSIALSSHNRFLLTPLLQRQCQKIVLNFEKFDLSSALFIKSERLTTLDISTVDTLLPAIRALPQCLTSLTIRDVEKPQADNQKCLLELPCNIVTFGLPIKKHSSDAIHQQIEVIDQLLALKTQKSANGETSFWFFRAKKFLLTKGLCLGPLEWLNVLPASLRSFDRIWSLTVRSNFADQVINFKKKLPLIKRLSLSTQYYYPEFSREELFNVQGSQTICPIHPLHVCRRIEFPPFLKRLRVAIKSTFFSHLICNPSCPHFNPDTQSILDLNLDPLPEKLENLYFEEDLIPKRLGRLPPKLEYLEFLFKHVDGMQITSNSAGIVTSWGRMSETFENDLLALPNRLQTLILRSDRLIGNCRAFFAALPPTITHLVLPIVENFLDEDVPYLPPKLLKLNIKHSENITDDGFYLLPDTLTQLVFKLNRKLTPKIFEHMRHAKPDLTQIKLKRNKMFPKALYSTLERLTEHKHPQFGLIFVTSKLQFVSRAPW